MRCSVIIPVYNEVRNIDLLTARLRPVLETITTNHEIIFINDGSTDDTLLKIKNLAATDSKVKFLSFSRNFGQQVAIAAGLKCAKGDLAVIMDGDLQDPPELIPELLKKYHEGYKVVYAKRISRKGESWFKKITAKIFYRLLAKLTVIEIPPDTGDFRLIDRQVVDYLNSMPENNKFLRGQIAWIGLKQAYVEFEREKRSAGKSGYSLRKMIRFAFDGITAFSDIPLRLATFLGFIVSLVAFGIIIWALYTKFIFGHAITGWTSLIISTMFIGGIQLLTIGIIGEYISRINTDVRKRPLYVIEDSNVDEKE
ncbi:MAG: glycosyltransferase family 2 protein [Bacteroidetes bacterium]|nr:glycosyltransferase family 2 protein [Bacteroidota bacterium]